MSASSPALSTATFPPRILLVEDDDELREGLAENLRLNGMTVTEADSGYGFHSAMRHENFDVTILDVNLPDTTGFDLVASMAADDRRPGVIMLTARTGQTDRIRGYSEGADLYMTKPVASEELLLAVRNLARRVSSTPPQEADRSGETVAWRLDVLLRRLVSPTGVSIDLSGREILVIEQFMGRNGEAVARQTLSETLGYGTPGPENRALDAVLRRLRKKFTDAGLEPPFASINNLGIRFIAPLLVVL